MAIRPREYQINGKKVTVSIAQLCSSVSSSSWKRFCCRVLACFEETAKTHGLKLDSFPYYKQYGGFWPLKGIKDIPESKYLNDNIEDTTEAAME